jgi:alpha-1,2-rhamnosyltransferase
MAKLNIYVEVTHTYHTDLNTGIQRVVRNVLREMLAIAQDRPDMYVTPVLYTGSTYITAGSEEVLRDKSFVAHGAATPSDVAAPPMRLTTRIKHKLKRALALSQKLVTTVLPFAPVRRFVYAPPDEFGLYAILLSGVNLVRGARNRANFWRAQMGARKLSRTAISPEGAPHGTDIKRLISSSSADRNVLLLLDSSWNSDIWPVTAELKLRGLEVVTIVYDLIPLTHPHTCVDHLHKIFKVWMAGNVAHSDAMICISQYIRDVVIQHVAATGGNRRNVPVSWFHLGSELDFVEGGEAAAPIRESARDDGVCSFLMVGSIEPRKNHRLVFEAFKLLWAAGVKARFIVVGKRGWKTEDLVEEMQAHPEFGRQLFLFREATDTDVEWLYRHASALIMASEVEGFGLPVVEAAQRGLPVICSDIPVFRELAIPGTVYFPLGEALALAQAVRGFVAAYDPATARRVHPWMTWRDSTVQMLSRIGIESPSVQAGDHRFGQQ